MESARRLVSLLAMISRFWEAFALLEAVLARVGHGYSFIMKTALAGALDAVRKLPALKAGTEPK